MLRNGHRDERHQNVQVEEARHQVCWSLSFLLYLLPTYGFTSIPQQSFTMVARTLILAAATLFTSAFASPVAVEKRANIDPTILQFALTLEHLENVFYKEAVAKFSAKDFEEAGFGADYYNNLKYIALDEQQHVALLSGALTAAGVTPVKACKYSFPYTDVQSFITLSSVLEGVGTSAYLAGAPLITSKQYLTVAGSILAIEALHTSYQRSAINEVPMANSLYTPLDPTSVYTLAAMFITSCPSSNAALPFKPFPTLQVQGDTCTDEEPTAARTYGKRWGSQSGWPKTWHQGEAQCAPPKAGDLVKFSATKNIPAGSYVTFVSGLSVVSVKGSIYGTDIAAKVPSVAAGQTYVFVTSANVEGTFDDSKVLFGPAVLEVKPAAPVLDNTQ
nr:protein rds1 [Quercus suber]